MLLILTMDMPIDVLFISGLSKTLAIMRLTNMSMPMKHSIFTVPLMNIQEQATPVRQVSWL